MIFRVLPIKFKSFQLSGDTFFIPEDIDLQVLQDPNLNDAEKHFLVSIPWNDSYLQYINKDYLDFFKEVLPYLHVRTTDIHTAVCFSFVEYFIQSCLQEIKERVVYLSLILHDIGWSQMEAREIADSLRVQGLALSDASIDPKERHAILGVEISKTILTDFPFNPPLNELEKELVCKAVLYHDKIKELAQHKKIPFELKVVADVDHLWSFTHQNFWQDTVRKGISPLAYWNNLKADLNGYFLTQEGKDKAGELLREREMEVSVWENQKKP